MSALIETLVILIAFFIARNLGDFFEHWFPGRAEKLELSSASAHSGIKPPVKVARLIVTALYCIPFFVALIISIVNTGTLFNIYAMTLIVTTLVASFLYVLIMRTRKLLNRPAS